MISLCPEFVELLVEGRFQQGRRKKYLLKNARIRPSGFTQPVAEEYLRARNKMIENVELNQPNLEMETWIPFANSADDIAVFVAGGPAGILPCSPPASVAVG